MRVRNWLILAAWAALACACATSSGLRYYALEARAPVAAASPAVPARIALGRVTVPELIDRAQLVSLRAGGEVVLLESDRWAEPLAQGIGRVVAADLAAQLGTPFVWSYPEEAPADAQVRVSLDIQRLDARAGGLVLQAIWTVRSAANAQAALAHHSATIEVPLAGHTAPNLVEADNQALAQLAQRIAASLSAPR